MRCEVQSWFPQLNGKWMLCVLLEVKFRFSVAWSCCKEAKLLIVWFLCDGTDSSFDFFYQCTDAYIGSLLCGFWYASPFLVLWLVSGDTGYCSGIGWVFSRYWNSGDWIRDIKIEATVNIFVFSL